MNLNSSVLVSTIINVTIVVIGAGIGWTTLSRWKKVTASKHIWAAIVAGLAIAVLAASAWAPIVRLAAFVQTHDASLRVFAVLLALDECLVGFGIGVIAAGGAAKRDRLKLSKDELGERP